MFNFTFHLAIEKLKLWDLPVIDRIRLGDVV